jgi:hypothetical protein
VSGIPWTLHRTIETRRCDFNTLLDELVKKHNIQDPNKLAMVIDGAARIYHGRTHLDAKDLKNLLRYVPKIRKILLHPDNDARIADTLMDRDNLLISGGVCDYKRRIAILFWLEKIKADISELERVLPALDLARPKHRRGNVKLHGMVASLERYWESLPGNKLHKTFTPTDKKQNRRLAKSAAMQFVEKIVEFIDPSAVRKIPSASRHRLAKIAK